MKLEQKGYGPNYKLSAHSARMIVNALSIELKGLFGSWAEYHVLTETRDIQPIMVHVDSIMSGLIESRLKEIGLAKAEVSELIGD